MALFTNQIPAFGKPANHRLSWKHQFENWPEGTWIQPRKVTIVFVFTALFLPSVIVNLLPNSHKIDRRIHALCSLVTWFNSMVNPIIYCFLNKRFRDEYRKILRLWIWRSHSDLIKIFASWIKILLCILLHSFLISAQFKRALK